jgi:hypothetical protein
MRKYHLVHNVVGFVCNLHEFIKHLSAIFPLLLLREIEIYSRVLFYDVIISPPTTLRAISPSKDYKKTRQTRSEHFKRRTVFPLSRMTFYGSDSSYALSEDLLCM